MLPWSMQSHRSALPKVKTPTIYMNSILHLFRGFTNILVMWLNIVQICNLSNQWYDTDKCTVYGHETLFILRLLFHRLYQGNKAVSTLTWVSVIMRTQWRDGQVLYWGEFILNGSVVFWGPDQCSSSQRIIDQCTLFYLNGDIVWKPTPVLNVSRDDVLYVAHYFKIKVIKD